MRRLIEEVKVGFDPPDIAINNAGIIGIHSLDALTVEEWDRVMNVNARGAFLCTQTEDAVMRSRRA